MKNYLSSRIHVTRGLQISLTLMGLLLAFGRCAGVTNEAQTYSEHFVTDEYGRNVGRGNLLGIQPYMSSADYRSEGSFYAKLDAYMALSRKKRWLTQRTIVLFPEVIGFYLVTAGERPEVYKAKSLEEAAGLMLRDHASDPPIQGLRDLPSDPTLQARRMLIAGKAAVMARIYQETFSKLAGRYRVTIVAGTIFLPSPAVRNGKIVCDLAGPLNNISAVFRPDGTIYPELVKKAFPPREEVQKLGIKRGDPDTLPVLSTPAGRLGVAICADSWFPKTYEVLNREGAQIIVTSSQYGDKAYMSQLWHGYSLSPGLKAPTDVDKRDIEKLTEGQAWIKYAMPGRMGRAKLHASHAKFGLTIFTRGQFWEETSDGGSPFVVCNGKLLASSNQSAIPDIVCLWLN